MPVVPGHHYSVYTGFQRETITAATAGFTEQLGVSPARAS